MALGTMVGGLTVGGDRWRCQPWVRPLIDVVGADAKEEHGVVTEDTNNGTENSAVGGGRSPSCVDPKRG